MPNAKDIIRQAQSLPVEQRAAVVDALLRSLNPFDPEIEQQWVETATRRLAEIRAGRAKPVPGDEVFARIRQRFSK